MHCKKLFFSCNFFFEKSGTSISDTPQYFFYLVIWHQYHIDIHVSLQFHPWLFRDVHWCCRQNDVRTFESTCPLAVQKRGHSVNIWKLPSKI